MVKEYKLEVPTKLEGITLRQYQDYLKVLDKWDKEDECVYNAYKLLMYVLEERLGRRNAKLEEKTPFGNDKEYANKESLFKYFETLINEMTEKVNVSESQRYNLALKNNYVTLGWGIMPQVLLNINKRNYF